MNFVWSVYPLGGYFWLFWQLLALGQPSHPLRRSLHFGLSGLLALTVSASLFSLFFLLYGRIPLSFFVWELLGVPLVATLVTFSRKWRFWHREEAVEEKEALAVTPRGKAKKWSLALGAYGLLLWGVGLVWLLWLKPFGSWDAMAFWNLRAKYLAQGEWGWLLFSQKEMWHPDYPLLLPSAVARLWVYWGSFSLWAPYLVAALFLGLTGLLLWGGLCQHFGEETASMATLTFLGATFFLKVASKLYADVPLGAIILMALLFLHLALEEKKGIWLFWAGLSAALAGWTKNEGLLFCAVATGGALWYLFREGRAKDIVWWLLGLGPALGGVLAYKLFTVPPNDVVNPNLGWEKIFLWERHLAIWQYVVRKILSMSAGILPLLGLFCFLFYWRGREEEASKVPGGGILLFVALGYYGVYLTTPHPLDWHLTTSLERLVVHLVPSLWYLAGSCFARGVQLWRGR